MWQRTLIGEHHYWLQEVKKVDDHLVRENAAANSTLTYLKVLLFERLHFFIVKLDPHGAVKGWEKLNKYVERGEDLLTEFHNFPGSARLGASAFGVYDFRFSTYGFL